MVHTSSKFSLEKIDFLLIKVYTEVHIYSTSTSKVASRDANVLGLGRVSSLRQMRSQMPLETGDLELTCEL